MQIVKAEGQVLGHPECVEFKSGLTNSVYHVRVTSAALQTCHLTDDDYCYDADCPLLKAEHKLKDHAKLPGRAAREGDSQPLPTPGRDSVIDQVLNDLSSRKFLGYSHEAVGVVQGLVLRREALGIQRYGSRLMTFNGRNAGDDAFEELLDAQNYYKQLHMETRNPRHLAWYLRVQELILEIAESSLD